MKGRDYFKPFEYPWAYDLWLKHEAMHWLGYEVSMHEDVFDWDTKMTPQEKELVTNLFRFFTQADVSVGKAYYKHFLPKFASTPELAMMLGGFANREAVHQDAYSILVETVGMDESEYKSFQHFKEMREKYEYLESFNTDTTYDLAKTIVVYSGFTEGMALFASFAILLALAKNNRMKNMGNIVAWSQRDEAIHVEGMSLLFKEVIKELTFEEVVKLEREAANMALQMVKLEDAFIDLCFGEMNTLFDVHKDDIKKYVRYIANYRMKQFGFALEPFEGVDRNPLSWIDYMVNGVEHTNFFEQKATAYSKAMTQGSMEEIEWM